MNNGSNPDNDRTLLTDADEGHGNRGTDFAFLIVTASIATSPSIITEKLSYEMYVYLALHQQAIRSNFNILFRN